MKIDIQKTTDIKRSIRVQQLEAMFEVPANEKLAVRVTGDLPIETRYWNIGLIVGPSGSGKTLTLRELFGDPAHMWWSDGSVIDSFDAANPVSDIVEVCKSVGFNTIPSWMRPYSVLSNGEQFRVEIARRLLEDGRPIIPVDEFTSVVDRQVAQIGSFAVAKYVRAKQRKLVAASCHYDIIDWLEPDWTFEPGTGSFQWRELRGRPRLEIEIARVRYEAWRFFAPFHYMSAELNKAARCYALFVNKRIAVFGGVLYRPHPKTDNIVGFTRMVTLPDWQGLGLAVVLANQVGAAYQALGFRLHAYPNHPMWIRSYNRNPKWICVKEAGQFSPRRGESSTVGGFGGRRCAVFAYAGSAMSVEDAKKIIA